MLHFLVLPNISSSSVSIASSSSITINYHITTSLPKSSKSSVERGPPETPTSISTDEAVDKVVASYGNSRKTLIRTCSNVENFNLRVLSLPSN